MYRMYVRIPDTTRPAKAARSATRAAVLLTVPRLFFPAVGSSLKRSAMVAPPMGADASAAVAFMGFLIFMAKIISQLAAKRQRRR